jgi:hypothetical protein
LGSKIPALLIRMSTSGSRSVSVWHPAAVETSAARPAILLPGATLASAVTAASTLACDRPLTTTLAPDSARPLAMAWPMPAVEPVTSAALPERSIFISVVSIVDAADIGSRAVKRNRGHRKIMPQKKRRTRRRF